MSDKEPYVLRFDGRVPAVRYYMSKEQGIKARTKYRKMGYSVLLHKVTLADERKYDTQTRPHRGDNDNFITRLANRLRRRRESETR